MFCRTRIGYIPFSQLQKLILEMQQTSFCLNNITRIVVKFRSSGYKMFILSTIWSTCFNKTPVHTYRYINVYFVPTIYSGTTKFLTADRTFKMGIGIINTYGNG